MGQKSESTKDIERLILKSEIKEELKDELLDMIHDKVKELVGPAVAVSLGQVLEFPLTIKQTAQLMGRTEESIYKMCQRDKIPFTKNGKKVYINIKDISKQLLSIHASD